METIKKSDIRRMVRELFNVREPNTPNYGNPEDDVVNVNDVVDDKLKNFCQQVSKNNCSEDDSPPDDNEDGLYYEDVLRKQIRSLIEELNKDSKK